MLGDPEVCKRLPPEKRPLKTRIPGIRFHGALRQALRENPALAEFFP